MNGPRYDVIIVGAGIVGVTVARQLSKYELKVALIDRCSDVACGATKANGGVVHPGYHARPGSLMAKLNVRGNELFDELTREVRVDFKRVGSIMALIQGEDPSLLDAFLEQGRQNGVPGLEIVGRDRLFELEPNLNPHAVAGLYSPTTGIVNPYELAIACANDAAIRDVQFILNTEVQSILSAGDEVGGVVTDKGKMLARWVINAAGVSSGDLARTAGDDFFTIHPRRGEIIVLDKKLGWLTKHVIYPVPTPESKGLLMVPTVEGNTMVASTAENIEDKCDLSTTLDGRRALIQGGKRVVPHIPLERYIIAQFSGIRAVADSDDFVITPSPNLKGLIHAAGIQSPGLASAPAIAEMVVDLLKNQGLDMRRTKQFLIQTPRKQRIAELTYEEIADKVKENRQYGNVVCRCEMVSEAEVIQAIHQPVGARTLDGIKRRTRAGTGRCQGAYCSCKIMEIMARELGISVADITKDGPGSELVAGPTKPLILGELGLERRQAR